jgi:DnaJ-class molecular chaperone
MASNIDYYTLLGVSKSATADDIKKAYRKLALEYHPDRNKSKDAEEKFKEITKAYEVLSNEEKRSAYDQLGHAAFEQGAGQGGPFGGGGGGGGQYGPFSYTYSTNGGGFDFGGSSDPFEIFEQFFGGSPFGNRQRRPAYSTTITFMDAVKGLEKEVSINGKKQKIKIPAGVDTGTRIRFEEYDLVIEVMQDARFMREGSDVVSEKVISFAQAAMGGEIGVETVDGEIKIRIPEGTQPGALIRLVGRGIPHVRGSGRGSHYVKIKIIVPKKLTKKQRELLEEFDMETEKKGWF